MWGCLVHWINTTHSLVEVYIFGELWESISSWQRRGARKGEQLREPGWELVKGVSAQGRREITEGVDGLLHSLGLEKRTWRISKKLLHIERFSASHCIPLSFTQQSNSMDSWASAQPVAGSDMGYESDGLSPSHAVVLGRKGRWVEESGDLSEWPLSPIEPLVCNNHDYWLDSQAV